MNVIKPEIVADFAEVENEKKKSFKGLRGRSVDLSESSVSRIKTCQKVAKMLLGDVAD